MTGTSNHSIEQQSGGTPARLAQAHDALPGCAGRSDRASRFLARLDSHLPIIPVA